MINFPTTVGSKVTDEFTMKVHNATYKVKYEVEYLSDEVTSSDYEDFNSFEEYKFEEKEKVATPTPIKKTTGFKTKTSLKRNGRYA